MSEEIQAKCFICHRDERWSVKNNTILARRTGSEGGARQPSVHPHLAAWRVLQVIRAEKIWRVIEPCPACEMPFAARQTRQVPMEWPLQIEDATYFVGPERNTGPDGLIDDDALNTLLEDAYRETFDAKTLVHPETWFKASLFSIFIAIFIAWLAGAFCLTQFYLAVYQQGLNGMP